MERRLIQYWGATGLFCLFLGSSGFAHSIRVEALVEAMTGLGYPVYVMSILGFAKLLGVTALLVPGRPILKEWAYAGFTFNLLGATASHAFAGEPLLKAAPPALLIGLLALSYHLRPTSRRIERLEIETPTATPPLARAAARSEA